jgi:hypothetical protein
MWCLPVHQTPMKVSTSLLKVGGEIDLVPRYLSTEAGRDCTCKEFFRTWWVLRESYRISKTTRLTPPSYDPAVVFRYYSAFSCRHIRPVKLKTGWKARWELEEGSHCKPFTSRELLWCISRSGDKCRRELQSAKYGGMVLVNRRKGTIQYRRSIGQSAQQCLGSLVNL